MENKRMSEKRLEEIAEALMNHIANHEGLETLFYLFAQLNLSNSEKEYFGFAPE